MDDMKSALIALIAAYEQQRKRRPLNDTDTIAVYYGDLRKLVDAATDRV